MGKKGRQANLLSRRYPLLKGVLPSGLGLLIRTELYSVLCSYPHVYKCFAYSDLCTTKMEFAVRAQSTSSTKETVSVSCPFTMIVSVCNPA